MSADIAFDPTEYRGSGQRFRVLAGQNLADRDLVYIGANGRYYRADSDVAATMPVVAMTLGPITQGRYGDVLSKGFIGLNTWTWVAGGEIYVSGVPGISTQTVPVAPGLIQVVGVAATATSIFFDPTMSAIGGAAIAGLVGDYTYLVGRTGANYFVYDNQGVIVQGLGIDGDVAINWALTTGGAGCVVYLKESTTFVIDDPIIFTANGQVVRGGGRSSFVDGDALGNNENAFELSIFTDCQIRNLSVQTNDAGGLTTHCIFIEDGADRFLIEDVTIVNSDTNGIHIEGTDITGGEIRNCDILGADDDGIYCGMDGGNYWLYGIIEENVITACGSEGMYLEDFVNGVVNDNIVYTCGAEGIQLNLGANCTISGNVSIINIMHGIGLTSSDGCVIDGNICMYNDSGDIAAYDGINIDVASTDNIISGNQTNFNHRFGIGIQGARNRVSDNKVAINDRHGIYIAAVDCQVDDNDCLNNGQDLADNFHEIALTGDADRCTIHDNRATSDGTISENCIHLADGASECSIMGNYCYNGRGSGIALTANNDDCSIIGNRCIDNDDYGIEITAATCNDTRVKENHLVGNVTGQFLDNGTDTQTPWFFAPVSDPNMTLGDHPGVDLPDATDTNVYAQILIPLEFQELVTCNVIVVSAATGDMVWTVDTDFGKLCVGENYNAHTDNDGTTTGITINHLECIDISAALTFIAGGDLVGVKFIRFGNSGFDTIDDSVYYLGIRMRYI